MNNPRYVIIITEWKCALYEKAMTYLYDNNILCYTKGHRGTRAISNSDNSLLSRRHGYTARVWRHEFGLLRPSNVLVEEHSRSECTWCSCTGLGAEEKSYTNLKQPRPPIKIYIKFCTNLGNEIVWLKTFQFMFLKLLWLRYKTRIFFINTQLQLNIVNRKKSVLFKIIMVKKSIYENLISYSSHCFFSLIFSIFTNHQCTHLKNENKNILFVIELIFSTYYSALDDWNKTMQ
jgi:hypothetical protein